MKGLLIAGAVAAISMGQEVPPKFSLYSDQKAKLAEDIITVLIIEEAQAKNDTRTEADINQRARLNLSPGSGKLRNIVPGVGFGMNNESDYNGRGKTSRSGAVKAKVSARIISVYDNGNLLIEGHKEVAINKETEIIRVSGIIRSEDILSDNTVYSFNIADAKITYSGKGDSHHAHRPGIFARFFAWLL